MVAVCMGSCLEARFSQEARGVDLQVEVCGLEPSGPSERLLVRFRQQCSFRISLHLRLMDDMQFFKLELVNREQNYNKASPFSCCRSKKCHL